MIDARFAPLAPLAAAALVAATGLAGPATAQSTDAAPTQIATLDGTVAGLRVVDPALAYVTTVGDAVGLYAVDLTDGTVTPVQTGLPLSAPGGMTILPDGTLLLADWNTEVDGTCCDGRVFEVTVDPPTFTPIYDGGALAPTAGDGAWLETSPGGVWGGGAFLVDFQGASPDPPFIARLADGGPATIFALDPAWTVDHALESIDFAPAGSAYPDAMYVSERLGPGADAPGLWRVDPAGQPEKFVDITNGAPWDVAFAAGCGSERMFVATSDAVARLLEITPNGEVAGVVVDGIELNGFGRVRVDRIDDRHLLLGVGRGLHVVRLCAGDLNGDCTVDFSDLVSLLAGWGDCGACDADLDGDGSVGLSDLLKVLATWGPCG